LPVGDIAEIKGRNPAEYTQGRGLRNRKQVCQGIDAGRIMGFDFLKDSKFIAVKIRFIAVKANAAAFSYRRKYRLMLHLESPATLAEKSAV
jgi:hypothetical protein